MGSAFLCAFEAEIKIINEPVIVKKININKKHRSITSAINRQPSLSYKNEKNILN